MRIDALHLLAFGQFSKKTIDLSKGREGLHIIYGANESGKSTSLRALHQALFGIPAKSNDNFKHAHPDMRIGMQIRSSDGRILKILRRKGNSKTLRNLEAENQLIEQSELQAFLGKINQQSFENIFGIDHERLVSGGADIVRGAGELGQLLFSAGAGITDLKSVLAGLEKDYQDLYTRGGSTRLINKQLSEYAEAKRLLKESELPSAEWERHDLALRQAQDRKIQLDTAINESRQKISRFSRYKNAIPLAKERAFFKEQILELSSISLLPDNFEDNARKLLEQKLVLTNEEENDRRKLDEINKEIESLSLPQNLLDLQAPIEALQQRLGSHRKAASDRSGLEASLLEEIERARACARDLGRNPEDFKSLSNLRLSVQEKTRLRKLALERRALWQAYSDAQALRQLTEQRLRQCSHELVQLVQAPDCEKLQVCYKRISQDPQMEERSLSENAKIERSFKQIVFDLRKLQYIELRGDEQVEDAAELYSRLSSCMLPDSQLIDSFDREWLHLDKEIESLSARNLHLKEELREAESKIQEEELKLALPTEADLNLSRQKRDAGWKLVLKSWKDRQENPDEIAEFCKQSGASGDLASAYQWALAKADNESDRLRHEADNVAVKIQLTARLQKLQGLFDDNSTKLAQSERRRLKLKKDWDEIMGSLSNKDLSPSSARLWISQFEALVKTLAQFLESKESASINAALVKRAKLELKEALNELDVQNPEKEKNESEKNESEEFLLSLLDRAQHSLDNYRRVKQSQAELERELVKLQVDLSNMTNTEQTRKGEIDLWAASWHPAVESLGLGVTTSPEELTAFLDRLEQFFSHYDQISNLKRRIDGIDRDAEQFASELDEIVLKAIGPKQKLSLEEKTAELLSALKKASQMQQRYEFLKVQESKVAGTSAERLSEIQKIKGRLALMMKEAGITEESGLLEAAKKSQQKRRLQESIESYERQLLRLAGVDEFETFINESLSHNPGELDSSIQLLEESAVELENERGELQLKIGSEKQILSSMDGSAGAAEAALRLEQSLAELGFDLEQYCRLKIASILLKKAIARYREKNQSPILTRASEYFAKLTNGNFAKLQEDFNEKGEPVLYGLRQGSHTLVPIEGMSEGSCDQVYLALRLAAISVYLDKEEALPFIVDDILVNFDDERSLATLKVLIDLSQRTQVILFTHHAHIVEMAKKHLDPAMVFFSSLNGQDRLDNEDKALSRLFIAPSSLLPDK